MGNIMIVQISGFFVINFIVIIKYVLNDYSQIAKKWYKKTKTSDKTKSKNKILIE